MKWRMFYLMLFLHGHILYAQIKQVDRIEFEANEDGVGQFAILGEHGVLIYGQGEEKEGSQEWIMNLYGTDLKKISSEKFEVPDKFRFVDHYLLEDKSKLFLLFKNKKNEYLLYHYNSITHSINSISGTILDKTYPRYFVVSGTSAFAWGRLKKDDVMVRYDLIDGKAYVVTIPGAGMRLSIENVQILEKENALAITTIHGDKKNKLLNVHVFDEMGKKRNEPIQFPNTSLNKPLSASITPLDNNHYIISGTYSSDKNRIANGIFLAEYKNGKQQFINYNSFTDLKNFTEFLSARQKARVDKKIERKKEKGKTDFVEAYVTSHPIFIYNNQYVYVGEVYYPTYRTEYFTSVQNGQTVTSTRQVFDGYQYSHATIIGMDKNGNKKWDYCFEMWLNYKPFKVKRYIRGIYSDTVVKLLFSTGTEIKSYIIKGDDVTERALGKIENQKEGDVVKWAENSATEFWYDNYFISFGSQYIKNKEDKDVKRKRRVYFLAKIKFD